MRSFTKIHTVIDQPNRQPEDVPPPESPRQSYLSRELISGSPFSDRLAEVPLPLTMRAWAISLCLLLPVLGTTAFAAEKAA